MKKPLTAYKLIQELKKLCEENGADSKQVIVHFRAGRDSYTQDIRQVEADLYNSQDNSTLESIALFNDPRHL